MGLSDQIKQPGQILGASSGASSGGNFGDLTGFPGDADDIMRGDGSASPLSGLDITGAGGALATDLATVAAAVVSEASARSSADTALAAPSYVTLATTSTLANERVLTGTTNQITVTDGGAGGNVTLSTPQNLHTGASPTFAGETLTQALALTGNQTTLGPTGTGAYRDVNGSLRLCAPSGGFVPIDIAGVQTHSLGVNGLVFNSTQTSAGSNVLAFYRDSGGHLHLNLATGAGLFVDTNNGTAQIGVTAGFGIEFLTAQAAAGSSIYNIYRASGGSLNYNVPTGATHIATVNGTRVGGFPLTAPDLPALVACAYNASTFAMSGGSTWEGMEFDTNANADTGLHAASSSTTKKRFVATIAGRWRATAIWAASTASAECRICKNDVAYFTPSSSIAPAAGDQRTITTVINCAANDYATLELKSAGTGSMHAGSTFTWEYLGV